MQEIGPLSRYKTRLNLKQLRPDREQFLAVAMLDKLTHNLLDYQPSISKRIQQLQLPSKRPGLFPLETQTYGPKGMWMYGGVGTGKTMLMNMFYETTPIEKKTRVHFHQFMQSVYNRINTFDRDRRLIMDLIARDIIKEHWLICFDEFQITDIATGTIVRQLFSHLLKQGAVVVATSNRLPSELNSGSFQKKQNESLASLLEQQCQILHLRSHQDYRKSMFEQEIKNTYFTLETDEQVQEFIQLVAGLFYGKRILQKQIEIYGRKVTIPKCTDNGLALFTFDELCQNGAKSMGPAEYLRLCAMFHTIVIQSVPQMGALEVNEARRFITFIDAAYENKTKLVISADEQPDNLFNVSAPRDDVMQAEMIGDILGEARDKRDQDVPGFDMYKLSLFTAEEEVFAFKRAVSRLYEMQTPEYWSSDHQPQQVVTDAVETQIQLSHELPLKPRKTPIFDESHFWGLVDRNSSHPWAMGVSRFKRGQ